MEWLKDLAARPNLHEHEFAVAILAALSDARKDRERLSGVQRVEMDMREDGVVLHCDGLTGAFCFGDSTSGLPSIAELGLDIMRRDG